MDLLLLLLLLLLCYAQYLILETVVLTSVYCIVLCSFVLFVCYIHLTSFMSDCCNDSIGGPTK